MQKKNLSGDPKVILTGSHARSTAYAVIQELKIRHKNWSYFWIGNKAVFAGSHIQTLEKKMFPKINVDFLPIVAGRLQRKFTVWTIPELVKIPLGFLWAFFYLIKIKPSIVVSFGGFAAFPVVVMAKLLAIPVLIHEQTSAAGRANIFSGKFADVVALARPESKKYFDPKKSIVTGNPVSQEVRAIKPKSTISKTPVIFVTGGASGSVKINTAVKSILGDLLKDCIVMHQTGDLQYREFSKHKNVLSPSLKSRYYVYPTIFPWDWHNFLERSDIIISRAGGNIVSEIMLVKRPAILIPIPYSFLSEQLKNAEATHKFGLAVILEQKDLTGGNLLNGLKELRQNWTSIVENSVRSISPDAKAHKNVADLIDNLVTRP